MGNDSDTGDSRRVSGGDVVPTKVSQPAAGTRDAGRSSDTDFETASASTGRRARSMAGGGARAPSDLALHVVLLIR